MYWDVQRVTPLSDYRLYVEIADGRRGIFDVKPYLDHGVFRELRNPDYFRQVGVVLGAVTWPHEQDIAPETLVAELVPVDAPPREALQRNTSEAARSSGSPLSADINSALELYDPDRNVTQVIREDVLFISIAGEACRRF
jgi:hypothetical protein